MELLGRENCTTVPSLTSNFNSHWIGKLLVVANEIAVNERKNIEDPLKTWITDATNIMEAKGVQQIEVRNRKLIWVNSNSSRPVLIAADDRCFSVFDSPQKGQEDAEYTTWLGSLFTPQGGGYTREIQAELAAWGYYLKNMTIDWAYLPRLYHSAAKASIVDASKGSMERFIDECREDFSGTITRYAPNGTQPNELGGFDREVVAAAYQTYCRTLGLTESRNGGIFTAMARAGMPERRRRDKAGARVRYFLPPDDVAGVRSIIEAAG